MIEVTALGAVILAGIGAGLIDINDIKESQITMFTPGLNENGKQYFFTNVNSNKNKTKILDDDDNNNRMYIILISDRDLRYSKWKMAVERSLRWDCSTNCSMDN